jgi:predicted nuclease of restriction endonuclease-like (RecB) superfamily
VSISLSVILAALPAPTDQNGFGALRPTSQLCRTPSVPSQVCQPSAAHHERPHSGRLRRISCASEEGDSVSAYKCRAGRDGELLGLYWDLGRLILDRQAVEPYGAKVIERLSADLRREFPTMRGLSPGNLDYMRRFAAAWPDREVSLRLVGKVPWSHNQTLLDRLDTSDLREWYASQAIEFGWSRAVLYVAAVDDILRRPGHNETVGLLLCTVKNERIVRYALGRSTSPMAVSGYRYTELPDDERLLLPGEAELTAVVDAAVSQFDASYGATSTPTHPMPEAPSDTADVGADQRSCAITGDHRLRRSLRRGQVHLPHKLWGR